jgi:DHA2 family methylenomycin A resistance protein-like MFS transporter
MTTGVLTTSPPAMSGLASGILNAGRQVGGAIGVALMGTLVQMHHDLGMVVSFAVALALFAVVAWWASRSIPEPGR